jgi:hypothetical protein
VERYQVENDSEDTGIELFAEYWSTSGSPRDPTKSYSSSQYVRIHRPDGTKWDIDLSGDHPMYWEVYVTTPAGRVKKLDIEYVGYQETLPLPAFTPHSDTE